MASQTRPDGLGGLESSVVSLTATKVKCFATTLILSASGTTAKERPRGFGGAGSPCPRVPEALLGDEFTGVRGSGPEKSWTTTFPFSGRQSVSSWSDGFAGVREQSAAGHEC